MKLTLALILFSSIGICGTPQRVYLDSNEFLVGETVTVGIDPFVTPCLTFVPNVNNERFYIEFQGNVISLYLVAYSFTPCPGNGSSMREEFDIIPNDAGEYTLNVNWVGPQTSFPISPDDNFVFLESANFSVIRGQPVAVNIFDFKVLILLGIVIFLLALKTLKKLNKKITISCLILISSTGLVNSKEFHILIKHGEGAPTPENIVQQANTSPSPPGYLLSSFNEAPPNKVEYLISNRPTGKLLQIMNTDPDWSRSRLHRYLVVTYDESADANQILSNFENDVYVTHSGYVGDLTPRISSSNNNQILHNHNNKGGIQTDLDIESAWELSEGMGYIGAIDLGFEYSHPNLAAFDSGNYIGGNILDDHYQIDFAGNDLNVDENEPYDTQGFSTYEQCDLADGVDDNMATSYLIGHGTHVSGLLAGKDLGICKNCGLSMMKWTDNSFCDIDQPRGPTLYPIPSISAAVSGMESLSSTGIGVVNWSGGLGSPNEDFCPDSFGACDALDFMRSQNTLMVGAAGNYRSVLQFPASEAGTVAVGGLDENGIFWNESPANGDPYLFTDSSNCPPTRNGEEECGSNYSHNSIDQKTDVVTQARNVYSTFYTGGEYAYDIGCEDSSDGMPNDGFGFCTGTSMAAPQVAAILQLMRSAHPLLPNGTYNPNLNTGLINVLNSTSSRSEQNLGVNDFLGYGFPNPTKALGKILGKSNDQQIKTRLTPMFALHSNTEKNTVYSPFPQVAMAFLLKDLGYYDPDTSALLVNEFTNFWYNVNNYTFPSPRANFYVFTTNNHPSVNLKNMVPLRRMEKTINGNNRNDTYAVSETEIEDFHNNDGYNYAGIEGYIFPICLSEPGCVPFGAHKLYRVEDTVNFNHKLINLPKTDPPPPNSTKLGYVYPNIDTDGDGLIDGQEFVLGTSHTVQDTDGDGLNDGFEYPPAGVPFSDPLISDIIFEDGFE